jgi:hypothetical protein
MGKEARRRAGTRVAAWVLGAWLVTLLWCTLFAESAPQEGKESAASTANTASSLYEQYRVVVERNVFSASARSPRPAPAQAPPAPPAGAEYVLTGVVAGGEPAVALVEESGSGQTRVYRLGEETPAGRVAAIEGEGVRLSQGDSEKLIRVGYTLAGERSAKLDTVVTTLASVPLASSGGGSRGRAGGGPDAGGPPANAGEAAAAGPAPAASGGEAAQGPSAPQGGGLRGGTRRFGAGGGGAGASAAPQNAQPNPFAGLSRDEVLQRMRARRTQEMGGGTGGQ